MKNNLLLIFTKLPDDVRSKTRLQEKLDKDWVIELNRKFLKILREKFKESGTYDLLWAFSEKPRSSLFEGDSYILQTGKGLGGKLFNAWSQLQKDYQKIVVIGSDAPQIGNDIIKEAFIELDHSEVVIGPAQDGGFYLFGSTQKFDPAIFKSIQYSTNETLNQLMSQLHNVTLLEESFDIDHYDDLLKLKRYYQNKKRSLLEENLLQWISIIDE